VERRPYLQTQWQLTDKLSLDAGVRYSSVWFDSNDYYITQAMAMTAVMPAITNGCPQAR
jgi:hypothetical protein